MESKVKNVVYVVAHDNGKEWGLYGSPFETPNMDRFARGGVAFTEAYCSSPCCSPSRGCAMTGRTAHSNGLAGLANPGWEWSLPEGSKTIVDDLNARGYETVHAGMQHERQKQDDNRYQTLLDSEGWVESAVDAAIRFLEKRSEGDPPFYLNIGTSEVHSGQWQTRKADRDHQRWKEVYGAAPLKDGRLPNYLPDLALIRREWEHFHGCVQHWDREMGRLFEAIEKFGYKDNTMVVVTTDHGVSAHRAKSTVYKEGVETGLAIQMPGLARPGLVVDHLIPNIDLLPTICEACGAPVREEVEGRSFLPLLIGEPYEPNERVFIERNFHSDFDPMRSVRSRRFTLIENFDTSKPLCWLPSEVKELKPSYETWFTELWPEPQKERPQLELFDREADPAERRNVADDPLYAEALAELRSQLRVWMEATEDPLLETTEPEEFKRRLREKFE